MAAGLLPDSMLGSEENPYFAIVVIELLTYAVPALFYCRIRGRDFTGKLRLKLFSPTKFLYISHASVFLVSGIMLISIVLYSAMPDLVRVSSLESYVALNSVGVTDTIYRLVTFAILPAVTEEFLFRGIVIGEYQHRGAGLAAFMSAVLFAMSHFSIERFPVYFFSGIVLAAVLYATDSLLAAIFVHTLNNAVVLLGEKYILHLVDKQNISLLIMCIILGFIVLVSGMLMCFEAGTLYRKYAEENKESSYVKSGKSGKLLRAVEAFFTPTFLLLVVLFVVRSTMEMQ